MDCTDTCTVQGCVFYANSATNGGGIRHATNQLTLTNCTLRNNTATNTGGGLYTASGEGAEMSSCLFWGNTASSGTGQIGGVKPYVHCCAIGGATRNGTYIIDQATSTQIGHDHGGQFVNTDPGFITNDPWHLVVNSVCIDKGRSDIALPTTDIDGNSRVLNNGPEIGADEVSNSTVPNPFTAELDNTTLAFNSGGSAPWFGETTVSYYGGDAAQSGSVSNSQESWIQTSVTGPGTVTFWWKVSSQANCDLLEFYTDTWRRFNISGTVDWQQKTYTVSGAGTHTLKWRYVKDASTSTGSDCGWVDYVTWTPGNNIGEMLDTNMTFTTSGDQPWVDTTSTYHYGGNAMVSGDISHSQQSVLETVVNGPGTIRYWWRVSSEGSYDYLEFWIDTTRQARISGPGTEWLERSFSVTGTGDHTLKWRYIKDSSGDYGSDCGWLDYVIFF